MLSMGLKKKDLLDFLYVKSYENKLVQYRNVFRFEAYSDIAMLRLYGRVVDNNFEDYRERVLSIVNSADIDETDTPCVSIELENMPDEIVTKIRWEKIKAKLDIHSTFRGNVLLLQAKNSIMLHRISLFVLCDCLDVSDVKAVTFSANLKELCQDFFKKRFRIDGNLEYLNLTTPLETLLRICGCQCSDQGELICQPYRSDVVNSAGIINDIFSAERTFFERRVLQTRAKDVAFCNVIAADQWQQNLLCTGYEYIYECCQDVTNIDEWIIKVDKNKRNHPFPHKFCAFICQHNPNDPEEIVVWHSGNGIDINEFADTVRRISVLSSNEGISWDTYGQELMVEKKGKKCGRVYLLDENRISQYNSNTYSIAVARIRL